MLFSAEVLWLNMCLWVPEQIKMLFWRPWPQHSGRLNCGITDMRYSIRKDALGGKLFPPVHSLEKEGKIVRVIEFSDLPLFSQWALISLYYCIYVRVSAIVPRVTSTHRQRIFSSELIKYGLMVGGSL